MSISGLCRAAGLSRQGYYQGRRARRRRACDEEPILAAVRQERRVQPRLGTRKLANRLGRRGIRIGRDRLFALLRRQDLLVKRKRRSVRTTHHDTSLPVYRNLLYQLEPTRPNQAWASDITYVSTEEGFVYLALVTDLVSRRIMGWHAGDSLGSAEAVRALREALAQLPDDRYPIHHSDRGCQYCCHEYVAVLRQRHLPVSMTEQNHCYENSLAERVNGILKDEYNLDAVFRTRDQARRAIAQAIRTYNTHRPHGSLNLLTPDEAHLHPVRPPTQRGEADRLPCGPSARSGEGKGLRPFPFTPSQKSS